LRKDSPKTQGFTGIWLSYCFRYSP